MTIAVLALQGAFIEHEQMLQKLGVHTIELRQASDLQKDFDGIILPGGESTVQGKLLHDLNMFEPLKEKIESGIPVLATCAGMILLASDIAEQDETYFETIPMTVKRNAYGRQLGSLHWCSNLYQIPIQIIKTNNLLSPAMRHQTIHILYIRIKLIQFFDKGFDILLLKI